MWQVVPRDLIGAEQDWIGRLVCRGNQKTAFYVGGRLLVSAGHDWQKSDVGSILSVEFPGGVARARLLRFQDATGQFSDWSTLWLEEPLDVRAPPIDTAKPFELIGAAATCVGYRKGLRAQGVWRGHAVFVSGKALQMEGSTDDIRGMSGAPVLFFRGGEWKVSGLQFGRLKDSVWTSYVLPLSVVQGSDPDLGAVLRARTRGGLGIARVFEILPEPPGERWQKRRYALLAWRGGPNTTATRIAGEWAAMLEGVKRKLVDIGAGRSASRVTFSCIEEYVDARRSTETVVGNFNVRFRDAGFIRVVFDMTFPTDAPAPPGSRTAVLASHLVRVGMGGSGNGFSGLVPFSVDLDIPAAAPGDSAADPVKGALAVAEDVLFDMCMFHGDLHLTHFFPTLDARAEFSRMKVDFARAKGLAPYGLAIPDDSSYVSLGACTRAAFSEPLQPARAGELWGEFLDEWVFPCILDGRMKVAMLSPEELFKEVKRRASGGLLGRISLRRLEERIRLWNLREGELGAVVFVRRIPRRKKTREQLRQHFAPGKLRPNDVLVCGSDDFRNLVRYRDYLQFLFFQARDAEEDPR